MCIVADSVDDVSNTKIAVLSIAYSVNSAKPLIPAQLVVYSASVTSLVSENAFILPIYNPGNDHTKIVPLDLSDMPNFFDDLDRIYDRWFPKLQSQSFGKESYSLSNSYNDEILAVHQVGDYRFSVMPSKYDFTRLDRSKLNIDPSAKVAIDVHSNDYSFIIYQFFQKGKLEVTPFGYICPAYRESALVTPTIHGHPHSQLPSSGLGYVPNLYVSYKSDFEENSEFDHTIYALVKNSQEQNSLIVQKDVVDMDKFVKQINTDYLNRSVRIYIPKNFIPRKIKIHGVKPNRNLLIKDCNSESTFIYDLTLDGKR